MFPWQRRNADNSARRRPRAQARVRPVVGGTRRFEAAVAHPAGLTRRVQRRGQPKAITLPRPAIQLPRIRLRVDRPRASAFILFVAVVLGLYELGNNDLFYVPTVDVQGNVNVPQAEIERAAGVTFWNIFFVEPRAAEAAVLKLPEIKYDHVTVELPRQVTLQVQERKPYFLWQSGGKEYWVDQEGLALRVRNRLNLPVIVDADARPVTIGQTVSKDAIEAANALQLVWPAGPRVYEWSAAKGMAVIEEHGWRVYFGNAHQMQSKVTALRTVTQLLVASNRKPNFIDLGNGLPYFQEPAPVR